MNYKVFIYGHKLYTHTHSWIHYGFYRAFQYLKYETYWVDDSDDLSGFDLSNSIFLTEGQVCGRMPLRRDCIYFLHNCSSFESIQKRVNFQYYTKDCVKMEHYSHGIAIKDNCCYFPWGSYLLPNEFNIKDIESKRSDIVYYIGTVNSPQENANFKPINEFAKTCFEQGHPMYVGGGYTGKTETPYLKYLSGWVSIEDEEKYSKEAYFLPALQGQNQLGNGMIPCRLFKAISFGNDGITNNPFAYEFFDHNVVFDKNPRELYFKAELAKMQPNDIERRKWLFNFVKEKHTYIQNINALMSMI
jgi:hypothetical protein